MHKILLLCLVGVSTLHCAFGKTYYIAPTGNDNNNGTITKPFLTIQRAQNTAEAGDTVYARGGTYLLQEAQIAATEGINALVTNLTKSGSPQKPICYFAYPGEKPVFDFSAVKPANLRVIAFHVAGSWIHLKGLEVVGVQVTILTHTQSECFENHGSNNIYEQLSMHDGQAIGFYLLKGSNNLILNCDAYRNWDYVSENKRGGNTDGFGCHPQQGSVNNVFRGCRAWFNSDDGYDCINSFETTVFENCWAFYNGFGTSFNSLGDGNGFKAGGYGARPFAKLPPKIPRNTIRFCLAVRNKANGFYANHHLNGSDWYNNSAYMNGVNFNMLNRKAITTEDYLTDGPGWNHVLKNNLGFAATSKEYINIDESRNDVSGNYFSLSLTASDRDFSSLNQAQLTASRKADGSLPDIDFMRLARGSKFIDAGVDVGFPFKGAKPDLGYREYEPK